MSQVFKDVGMLVRGEMFPDGSGKVSAGFTNIQALQPAHENLQMSCNRKSVSIGSLTLNQLVILHGVNTNLMPRSLQKVLTIS